MRWTEIIGHEDIINMLQVMLKTGRIPHSLLFVGPAGIGKGMVANVLAAALLCHDADSRPCGKCLSCAQLEQKVHPDLLVVRPEGRTIKIEQIRAVQHEMSLAPYTGRYKVCIIEEAETMTKEAANSLLKVLEEPPGDVVFILVSAARYRLLQTIISRCRLLSFQPIVCKQLAEALIAKGFAAEQAKVAARLSSGRMGTALNILLPDGLVLRDMAMEIVRRIPVEGMSLVWDLTARISRLERNELLALLKFLTYIFRDILLIAAGQTGEMLYNTDLAGELARQVHYWQDDSIMSVIREIKTAERAVNGNANIQLSCEGLLISMNDVTRGDKNADSGRSTV